MDPSINLNSSLNTNLTTETLSKAGSTTQGSSNPAGEIVDLKTKVTIQDLINLGLTPEQAAKLLNENPNITKSEVNALIARNNAKAEQPQAEIKTETNESSSFKKTTGQNFDFAEFAQEKDPLKKANTLAEEYTKNLYQDKWDSFTEEEKALKQKEAVEKLIQQNNKTDKKINLDMLKTAMENPEQLRGKINKRELKNLSDFVNSSMTSLQTANMNGLTLEEFQKQDKEIKNAQKYSLIENLDTEKYNSLAASDKQFFETEKLAVDAARDFFKDPNLKPEELSAKIQKYNETAQESQQISKASLTFETLKQKKESGTLTQQTEKSIYRFYKNLSTNGADLAKIPDFDSSNSTINDMLQSKTYQEALKNNKNDHRTAMKYYLNEQLKGGDKKGLSPEEFDKKFNELISGCSSAGARELMSVAAEMKKDDWIVFQQQNLATGTKAMAAGIDDVSVDDIANSKLSDKEQSMWLNTVQNSAIRQGKMERAIAAKRKNKMPDTELQAKTIDETIKEGIISKKDAQSFTMDHLEHTSEYSPEAISSYVKAGGKAIAESLADKKFVNEYASKTADMVENRHDAELTKDFASSGSTYKGHKDAQLIVANRTMEISNNFEKKYAVEIQNALADDIQNYDKGAQLEAHNIVMQSSYSEVQERAASNIHNYHESVQADAFKTVLKSGNQKAIESAVTSYDKMPAEAQKLISKEYQVQSAKIETAYTQQIAQEVGAALDKLEDGSTKLADMSTEERIKYYTDKFVNGKPSERRAMFQKMLDNGMSKDTFKKLVKYCPELLISMMGDLIQRGLGESILNCIGKSSDLTYKVVNAMMSSGNMSDKKAGAKYVTENPSQFSKSTRENAEDILHKLVSTEDNKKQKTYQATA